MASAGVLAVAALATLATPPDPHALTLRRSDVPAGWSSQKATVEEIGSCPRVPYIARAYSPGFAKVTSSDTKAVSSRATVYSSVARAQQEIHSSNDPQQAKCFEDAFRTAARRAFGAKTQVSSLAVHRPRSAASAFGFLITYRTRGILVRSYYEYVYIVRGRVISALLVFGVFRRVDDAFISRLTDVLARRLSAAP